MRPVPAGRPDLERVADRLLDQPAKERQVQGPHARRNRRLGELLVQS